MWTILTVIEKDVTVEEFTHLESAVKKYRQNVIDIQRRIERGGLTTTRDVRDKSIKFEYAITVRLFAPNWSVMFDWTIDT